jgi:hypothetical protein
MRKNLGTTVVVVLLLLGSLLTAGMVYWYGQLTLEMNRMKAQMEAVDRNQNLVKALAAEAVEYSKHNASIDPILQTVGLKPKPAPNATPAPAKK